MSYSAYSGEAQGMPVEDGGGSPADQGEPDTKGDEYELPGAPEGGFDD